MDAEEVIGSIDSIFDKFQVPQNLRMHMYRVASLAELICDNWKGPTINKTDIVAVSLIHDLGNIVKFDTDSEVGTKLLGPEAKDIDRIRELKSRIVTKYGIDDHEVTLKMVKELGVSERLMFILTYGGHAFTDSKMPEINDWDIKIHAYTDFRAGPFGIMPMKDRFEEFRVRQKIRIEKGGTNWSYSNLDAIIASGYTIEKQIQMNVLLPLEQIDDKTIQPYLDKYLKLK